MECSIIYILTHGRFLISHQNRFRKNYIFPFFFLNCDNFYNKVLYKMYDEINIK